MLCERDCGHGIISLAAVVGLLGMAAPLPGAKNIAASTTADGVDLIFDLTQNFGPSSGGKTDILASTVGNKPLGRTGATLGVNLYISSGVKATVPKAPVAMTEVGFNMLVGVNDELQLVVRMLLNKGSKPSSSGKTVLLVSGQVPNVCGTGARLGINCYTKDIKDFHLDKLETMAQTQMRLEGNTAVLALGCSEAKGTATTGGFSLMPGGAKIQATLQWDGVECQCSRDAVPVPESTNLFYRWVNDGKGIEVSFDTSVEGKLSASDKSRVVASTKGKASLGARGATLRCMAIVPIPASEVLATAKAAIKRATEAFVAQLEPEHMATLKASDARAAVQKDVSADIAESPELKAYFKDTLRGLLASSQAGKRDRDGDDAEGEAA